jgi:TRAP-type uncharacterized transport system substrate-binding protein
MRLFTFWQGITWRDIAATSLPLFVTVAVAIFIAVHFLKPAPPTQLTMAGGPEGSAFLRAAEKYKSILARSGVTLKILPSEGSADNLNRLTDPDVDVDIGLVQGGLAATAETDELVSLGSVFYEPLFVFYRNPTPIQRLSELRGRRIAIGHEGSGTHALAQALLKANGIEARNDPQLTDLGGATVAQALIDGRIDAAFLMSDSSVTENIRDLLHAPHVRLFSVTQPDAYLRNFRYLAKLDLGAGTFDLGANIPPEPVSLLAPTVELLARSGLHPALSDLLIEAAREVHGHAGLLRTTGEFPAPLEHEYTISDDAARYYKSGKSFSYRYLPFWLATIVDRIVVVLIPTLLLLIPTLRLLPALYSWRIRRRIHRRYAELMALERLTLAASTEAERKPLRERLEEIDERVITLKIPAAFADQVYVLREHIKFVRERLAGNAAAPPVAP